MKNITGNADNWELSDSPNKKTSKRNTGKKKEKASFKNLITMKNIFIKLSSLEGDIRNYYLSTRDKYLGDALCDIEVIKNSLNRVNNGNK